MNWREICFKVHDEGVQKISMGKPLPFMVRSFYADGTAYPDDLLLDHGLGSRDRVLLRTVTPLTFSEIHLPAALIQSDARAVDGQKFAEYFGIPEDIAPLEYEKEYVRILHEKFGDSAANLPQETWSDAVITCIKGPLVMPTSFLSCYEKTAEGMVKFDYPREKAGFHLAVLPDWWKSTIN